MSVKLKYICNIGNFVVSVLAGTSTSAENAIWRKKVLDDKMSVQSDALRKKRKLKRGIWEERTEEKKQEDSVLHQVETSSDRSSADTQNNIHQKEQWSGPWH